MALTVGGDELEVVKSLGEGRWMVAGDDLRGTMERSGRMPLPPYIEATAEAEGGVPDGLRAPPRLGRGSHCGVPLHRRGPRGGSEGWGRDRARNVARRHGDLRPHPDREAGGPQDARRALRRPRGGRADDKGCREGRRGRDYRGADARDVGCERRSEGESEPVHPSRLPGGGWWTPCSRTSTSRARRYWRW